jgi:hypothetical protein
MPLKRRNGLQLVGPRLNKNLWCSPALSHPDVKPTKDLVPFGRWSLKTRTNYFRIWSQLEMERDLWYCGNTVQWNSHPLEIQLNGWGECVSRVSSRAWFRHTKPIILEKIRALLKKNVEIYWSCKRGVCKCWGRIWKQMMIERGDGDQK